MQNKTTMDITILSPAQTIYNGVATLIQLPGVDGLFEIMDNHAPIIALLATGKIKIKDSNGQDCFFEVLNGVIQVKNNQVTVLCEQNK
jgi:F-type H+-transporting ATPase subunit epsilon